MKGFRIATDLISWTSLKRQRNQKGLDINILNQIWPNFQVYWLDFNYEF